MKSLLYPPNKPQSNLKFWGVKITKTRRRSNFFNWLPWTSTSTNDFAYTSNWTICKWSKELWKLLCITELSKNDYHRHFFSRLQILCSGYRNIAFFANYSTSMHSSYKILRLPSPALLILHTISLKFRHIEIRYPASTAACSLQGWGHACYSTLLPLQPSPRSLLSLGRCDGNLALKVGGDLELHPGHLIRIEIPTWDSRVWPQADKCT